MPPIHTVDLEASFVAAMVLWPVIESSRRPTRLLTDSNLAKADVRPFWPKGRLAAPLAIILTERKAQMLVVLRRCSVVGTRHNQATQQRQPVPAPALQAIRLCRAIGSPGL